MAQRFVRIDLSGTKGDFRPVAIEPGLPLLDRAGGNGRMVARWLGRLAGLPEWDGPSVGYFVQDDQGGRLEEVYCQPATRQDLQEFLGDELAILRRRLDAIRPESPSQQDLAAALRRNFAETLQEPLRDGLDSYFFRYRDVNGHWRLVWCWGYQRSDLELAPAVICSDPDCSLLFLRRPHGHSKCPSCHAVQAEQVPPARGWGRLAWLGLLLLALGGLAWWYGPWARTPSWEMSMVVGEVADVPIRPARSEWNDISSRDPHVVQIAGGRLVARGPGRTVVDLAEARRSAEVHVTVVAGTLELTAIDPPKPIVPLDGNVRLKALGQTADKRPVEITPDVVLIARRPSPEYVALDEDTLELKGLEPTDAKSAQTLALSLGTHEVAVPVVVVGQPEGLELTPAGPASVPVGQAVELRVRARYSGNREADVPADRVQWHSEPNQVEGLAIEDGRVTASRPAAGPLSVWATYHDRDSNRVEVRSAAPAAPVVLEPKADPAEPQVGQTGRVEVGAAGETLDREAWDFQSDRPDVLAVDAKTGVFRALAPGEAKVRISHPGVQKSELTLHVTSPPSTDRPVDVSILSDQGSSVRVPVGGQFDDFRVEAEYADGATRLVTRKAVLRTLQPASQAAVAVGDGRIVGLRPGQSTVTAQFEGVTSYAGLDVTVVEGLQPDALRLRPAAIAMQPGETLRLEAIGYCGGRSLGTVTDAEGLVWQSSDPKVARAEGPWVTALSAGRAQVTATLGGLSSTPATVEVVDALSQVLRADPERLRIHVGEALGVGRDILVHRGDLDLSAACDVQPASPDVVRFDPSSRALVGLTPGASPVTFAYGDRTAYALVEVLPAEPGISLSDILVEPSGALLAPGQAVSLQVFGVLPDGRRVDRTSGASLVSSDPNVVSIHGSQAYAIASGRATVTAALPEVDKKAKAALHVLDEKVRQLQVDPPRLELGVGDRVAVRVLGTTRHGTYEMFPQRSLQAQVGGSSPSSVRVDDQNQVEALKPGQATVTFRFGAAQATLPVEVLRDAFRDLRIEPAEATIRPGDVVSYQVSAWRTGTRYLLPPDRVRLSVANAHVASVERGLVRGLHQGRTTVQASVGDQSVEAGLTVARRVPRSILGAWPVQVLRPDRLFAWGDLWPWQAVVPQSSTLQTVVPQLSKLWIEPGQVALDVGQQTPPMKAMATDANGRAVQVPAPVESLDPSVLEPVAGARFAARRAGSAQVRVQFGGREAFADVTVRGARFRSITSRLQEGTDTFQVTLDVRAAKSEGPLEYRVYVPGTAPPDRWQASEESGDHRHVVLQSPPIRYREREARYQLMIEARDPSGKSVQQYPFGFRLAPSIERTDPGERSGPKGR